MSFYKKISKSSRGFLNYTGMPLESFDRRYPTLEKKHEELEALRKQRTVVSGELREREAGGGRKYENDLKDRVVMLLMYYRLYLTQDFMTLLFKATNKSVISRSFQTVKPLVELCLPTPEKVKKASLELAQKETSRRKRIGTIEEFKAAYPELEIEILIDGKEQPKRRPKDKEKKKNQYSGKKKRHTLKQLIASTRKGLIIYQGNSFEGSTHDFEGFKAEKEQIFSGCEGLNISGYFDAGFQGIEKLRLPENITIKQVMRAFRNKPLTPNQKKINKLRGSIRVAREHVIGKTKKYRIASDIYRNSDQAYDSTMTIVAGLVNLRLIDKIYQEQGISFKW